MQQQRLRWKLKHLQQVNALSTQTTSGTLGTPFHINFNLFLPTDLFLCPRLFLSQTNAQQLKFKTCTLSRNTADKNISDASHTFCYHRLCCYPFRFSGYACIVNGANNILVDTLYLSAEFKPLQFLALLLARDCIVVYKCMQFTSLKIHLRVYAFLKVFFFLVCMMQKLISQDQHDGSYCISSILLVYRTAN